MRSVPVTVAVAIWVAACTSGTPPAAPSPLGGALSGPAPVRAGASTTTVHRFADGTAVPGASSTLARTGNGVSMTLQTSELEPNAAYTVWWVVFNHPSACATSPCGEPDLFDDDVAPLVTHAAGHIVGANGKGNFAGSLREGVVVDNLLGEFGGSPVGSLVDAQEAEIHLVVRTHGPKATPGGVPRQIHTFEVLCAEACSDVQFAIHQLQP